MKKLTTRNMDNVTVSHNTVVRLICLAALAVCALFEANAAKYTEKELWINNGARRIYGVLASPEGRSGRLPVAIIAHGFNGDHKFGRNYFDTLCALGYRCYTFDFPCGSTKSRSDANTMNMSVKDEESDIKAIVRHFMASDDTDTTGIVLIGESQGGLVSALAAADLRDKVSRLVLVYPALCIPDNWNSKYKNESEIPDTTLVWRVPLGRRFFSEVRAMDVYSTIGLYKGPVQIVHGDKDPVVPIDYSRRAVKTYADARLHVIKGAGHGFNSKGLKEALGCVASFLTPLDSAFARPPQDARPIMIWQWMDGMVSAEGITADLEAYKRAGIGGVQQFMVGGPMQVEMRDTTNAIGTDNWRRLMRHAMSECRRLGLSFGTHNCPGWSSSAFPTVTPEYSMQKLVWTDTIVSLRRRGTMALGRPKTDPKYNYYSDIAVLAMPADSTLATTDITDVSAAMSPDGTFDFKVLRTMGLADRLPKGKIRLMRFGHTTNGKTNSSTAPYGGVGLECDKMSREAVKRYWQTYPKMLLDIAGDMAGNTFCRIEIDSYEAGGQDWTPRMAEEFKTRRGYDLLTWLPAMAGLKVGGKDEMKRFNADFRKTVCELFAENYYGYMGELAHHTPGMKLLYQPYGTGKAQPFNPISTDAVARQLPDDYLCTEFWLDPQRWGWPQVPRHTSVAHRYGMRRVFAEGFTSWALSAWRETPEDLKQMGDRAFCLGVNSLMLHAGAQNPWPKAVPGMTFGMWGAWWTPGQTWWRSGAARLLFGYFSRCQALLQRGQYADDYTIRHKSLATDATGLQWTHRRDGYTDIYFIANTLDSAYSATVKIASTGREPEIWQPENGQKCAATAWTTDGKSTAVTLHFDEHQSLFIVLRRHTKATASTQQQPRKHSTAHSFDITGAWQLSFPEGWGAPAEVQLDSLIAWNEHRDEGVRYFSGTATYKKTIRLNDSKARYTLDLGDVKNTARVIVNGKECAHLWKKPFRCDITDAVKKGDNTIEIEVTNLWPNRMIGDEQLPDDIEWGKPFIYSYAPGSPEIGRPMKSAPDWLTKGETRPQQGRKTVVSFKFFKKTDPLLPSGLLGPVKITAERQ